LSYKTILKIASAEIVEKKSRFIGAAFPIESSEEANEYISAVKKEHFSARHNCYAYRLRDGTERYSDDGEPQKTAGLPMLDMLKKEDITDVLVVVTRYFGGVLLGTGGLVRAYTAASQEAVYASQIVLMTDFCVYNIVVEYQYFERIKLLIEEFEGQIEETNFSENIKIAICVKPEKKAQIDKKIIELTAGKAIIDTDIFYKFKPEIIKK